jgi:hypothetical protein
VDFVGSGKYLEWDGLLRLGEERLEKIGRASGGRGRGQFLRSLEKIQRSEK